MIMITLLAVSMMVVGGILEARRVSKNLDLYSSGPLVVRKKPTLTDNAQIFYKEDLA